MSELVWRMSPTQIGSRARNVIATVVVATVIAGAAALTTPFSPFPPSPPSSGTANIWVDTSGGTCADSTTLVSYPNNGTECATLAAAIAAAEPGDVVGMHVGVYPGETIAYRASLQNLVPGCDPYGKWGTASTTNCIHVINDGDVTIRGLVNNASSLWVEGTDPGSCSSKATCDARTYDFHITNSDLIGNPPAGAATDANCNCKSATFRAARPSITSNDTRRPDHVIWDGIDSDTLGVWASSNVYVRNADVGPMWFDTSIRGDSSGSGPDVPVIRSTCAACAPLNIFYEGVYFHEMNRTFWCDVNNACHPDGLFISNGTTVTLKNVGFSQIAGEVLFFENFNGGIGVTNFTMENSWFGCKVDSYPDDPANARTTCGSGASIDFKNCGSCDNFLLRFNSWHSIEGAEVSWTNARFVGNAGRQPPSTSVLCTANSWTSNVFYTVANGGNCGASNSNTGSSSIGSLFSNGSPGSENFHLAGAAGSTLADDFVAPGGSDSSLATDVDGETRPQDVNRDAGADERDSP